MYYLFLRLFSILPGLYYDAADKTLFGIAVIIWTATWQFVSKNNVHEAENI
jgi:hypothetical protein